MDAQKLLAQLHGLKTVFDEKESELTALDREIGDGDHGVNMKRGFNAVDEKVSEGSTKKILKQTGMTLMSSIGGASGPLYGFSFVKMSDAANDEIDADNLAEMLDIFTQTVAEKGKVEGGEKTMYDVISKSADVLRETGGLKMDDVQKLADDTEDMIATKGRAAYFKEKSKGTVDPGAQSAVYIIHALGEGVDNG
ncbi:MAG TPA: dihydroxyacetone kinase subunit L [Candidatus Salinicoccus stercoripullorum]|uniref:phosphoenolpyruvate--glycerone phosphotransferase n=1 Tax=Candidatus Salinicoccus stercoripullorum TaxID=2838756 RepID=A0A9D1TZW2_9STAP|nr:dihydroxyacetone kinase subunit L [Candidatus Salinicoccus stercoripullorum]